MAIGLTAGELAQIRADIGELLPDICHIMSLTRTSDAAGGWLETWGTATANVACRVDFSTPGNEAVTNFALVAYQGGYLSLPWATSITEANRVIHGGYTYAVTGVNVDQSWIGVKRCNIERVP